MSQELIKTQIEAPATLERFTKIFGAVHKVAPDTAQQMYEVEKFHFMRTLAEKGIADATPISSMGVFLEVVSNGLSFSSNAKHVHLMTRSVKSGRKNDKGKDIYENRLVYSTQADGKIFQAQRAGSIEYVTKPVIVYESDEFAVGTDDQGRQIVIHKAKLPRAQNAKIIAGYVYVVFPNGNREPFWMDQSDIDRLKWYSSKNNSRWDDNAKQKVPGPANELFSSNNGQIDPGFFGTKLIQFALKNVRKAVIANAHEVEEDTQAPELPQIPDSAQFQPAMIVEPAKDPFEQPNAPASITTTSTTHYSPAAAGMPHATNEPF